MMNQEAGKKNDFGFWLNNWVEHSALKATGRTRKRSVWKRKREWAWDFENVYGYIHQEDGKGGEPIKRNFSMKK